jgi:hypothetical protein
VARYREIARGVDSTPFAECCKVAALDGHDKVGPPA